MIEELVSKQELEADITAELRFAELKGDKKTASAMNKALRIIQNQKVMGYVNPTQFVFYGADRE